MMLKFWSALIALFLCVPFMALAVDDDSKETCPTYVASHHFSGYPPTAKFLRFRKSGSSVVLQGNRVMSLAAEGTPLWEKDNPLVPDAHCTEATCQVNEVEFSQRPLVMVWSTETATFAIFDVAKGELLQTDYFGDTEGTELKFSELKTNGTHSILLYSDAGKTKFEIAWAATSLLVSPVSLFRCTAVPVYGFSTQGKLPFAFPSNLEEPNTVRNLLNKNVIEFDAHLFRHILQTKQTHLVDAFVVDDKTMYVVTKGDNKTSVWKVGDEQPLFTAVGSHTVKFHASFAEGLDQSARNLRGLKVVLVDHSHIGVYELTEPKTLFRVYAPNLKARNAYITDDGKFLFAEAGLGLSHKTEAYDLEHSGFVAMISMVQGSMKLLDVVTIPDQTGTNQPPVYSLLFSKHDGIVNWHFKPAPVQK